VIASPPGTEWRRLHPLTPLVRFGRLILAVALITVPYLGSTRSPRGRFELLYPVVIWAGLIGLGSVSAIVSWAVTRWRIDGGDLRIETGFIRKQSIRIPLARIQAVDIVAPLIARVLGLAEVRVVSAGRGGEHGRLAYLTAQEAPQVRARLLALAHGLAAETPEPPAVPLLHVDNGRLVAGLSMRAQVLVPLTVMLVAIIGAAVAPGPGVAALGSVLTIVFAAAVALVRAFNEDFDFSISEAGDGLRLDRGLLQRRHETIPFGRIQAVRLVQPVLWRVFGWWRLEVDVARQHGPRDGSDQGGAHLARTLVPVAPRAQALWVLARVFPDAGVAPPAGAEPPTRALAKAPLSYHYLAAWYGNRYVYARTGRVQQAIVVVPLGKIQSLRLREGPVQRRLRLATLDIDTAGRRWEASARCRDVADAERMLWELTERARIARRTSVTHAAVPATAPA